MAAKNKASQLVVWVLMAMLIVGLMGFGVGNFGGTVSSVASVGDTEIDVNTYARAVQREMQSVEGATGQTTTFADLQAQGLDRAVLQALLGSVALDEATRLAGLSVGDARVGAQIQTIDAFQGINGQFDREAYEFMLDRNNMSVAEFEDSIRVELSRNLFQAAVVAGLMPQPAYADAIYRYVAERRTLSLLRLSDADLDAPVDTPDEAALKAHYDANQDLYTLPERKAITYAWLTPAMLSATIEIDDAVLKAAFDDRADEFNVPERRLVERLAFADEAAASAAMAAIDAGEKSFDDFLAERDLTVADVDLGPVAEGDLDGAGADVFALADTGVVGPLPSAIGPALFRVTAILSPRTTSFEEARAELLAELQMDRALDLLADEFEPLEDLLAGGATLEELVAETDAELGQINWSGPAIEGIATYAAFNELAQAVTTSDFPEIRELDDGSLFAIRLDEVMPPAVQPMEDVRAQVEMAAREEAVRAALSVKVDELKEAMTSGLSEEDLGLSAEVIENVTRSAVPEAIPLSAVETVFTLEEGGIEVIEDGAALVVLRLDAILPPSPEDANAGFLRNALNQQAAEQMAQDVLTQIARAVEASEGITINQTALNAVHAQLP